jgi:hypothetical protein
MTGALRLNARKRKAKTMSAYVVDKDVIDRLIATTENDTRLSGVKPRLVGGTLLVALPVALQRTIEGGCACPHCVAHPNETPMWDTLAIDAKAQRHTWTVHYPEMRAWR